MENQNFAEASMMIRKPVAQVYEAFINPEVTTRFWFTKSSGILEEGKDFVWSWEMYGVSTPVHVLNLNKNKALTIRWGEEAQASRVQWTFNAVNEKSTFVHIKNDEFQATGSPLVQQIRDSTGGFTLVLAGLKAFLEYGVDLNLIGDKWPPELR